MCSDNGDPYRQYENSVLLHCLQIIMKKVMLADLIKQNTKDTIEGLLSMIEAGEISLDAAQEEAWVIYGYPEGGEATSHSSSWAGLWAGGSQTDWVVNYEPIFESLGDTLDDDPIYSVTRISIQTINEDYPHSWSSAGSSEHSLESIQFLEQGSCARWFNEYCGDHRFK